MLVWLCLALAVPDDSTLIPGMQPGPPPAEQSIDPITQRLAEGLRCPVCQGLSIADSGSEAARAIQNRIREMVAAGYTEEQVEDYFVSKYGEWILLEPPPSGINWLIWLGPAVAGGFGLTWAAATVSQWRKEPDEFPLPSDEGMVAKDKYEARLLAELEE